MVIKKQRCGTSAYYAEHGCVFSCLSHMVLADSPRVSFGETTISTGDGTLGGTDITFSGRETRLSLTETVVSLSDKTVSLADQTLSLPDKGLSTPDQTLSGCEITLSGCEPSPSGSDQTPSTPDQCLSVGENAPFPVQTSISPRWSTFPPNHNKPKQWQKLHSLGTARTRKANRCVGTRPDFSGMDLCRNPTQNVCLSYASF